MDISIRKRRAVLQARNDERDYMMRSEKRPGYRPPANAPKPPKRRRHRRKQSLPYVFMTFLLLLVLYPVGLVMLWTRSIRWTATTKLSLTAGFALVFVLLGSFALTVKLDNPTYTRIQQSARYQIGVAGAAIQDNLNKLDLDPEHILRDTEDIAGYSIQLCQRGVSELLPVLEGDFGTIGETVALARDAAGEFARTQARRALQLFDAITPAPEETGKPGAAPTPSPVLTHSPAPQPTPAPTALLAWYVQGGAIYHTRADCPRIIGTATSVTVTEAVNRGLLPCDQCAIPDALEGTVPAVGGPSATGGLDAVEPDQPDAMLSSSPEPSLNPEGLSARAAPSVRPTATPRPTPSPTPIVLPPSKSAAEATVYYTGNGKYYHTATSCGSMRGAKPHTLKEAVDAGLKRCNACNAPDPALLEADVVVWRGADDVFHIADDCEKLSGKATLLSLEDAVGDGSTGCPVCGANLYEEVAKKYELATPVPAQPVG